MLTQMAPKLPDWYAMDDKILIKSHLDGDDDAFEVLVRKYQSTVRNLAYSIMRHDNGVSDVVQDVFLSVFRGLKKFRGDSSFKTWLYKITVHETFRHLKKRKRWNSLIDENKSDREAADITVVMIDKTESPERLVLDSQSKELIQSSISELSENHRAVLYLHYNEDLSVQEIGEILDIPVGSVKSRLHYARLRLKELLKPYVNSLPERQGARNAV